MVNTRVYFAVLAILCAIVMLAPIRSGDLAGYDDARYALVAKDIVVTGNWTDLKSNGQPALEHPPLLPWIQALLFIEFGFSDPMAKLPSALCGIGTVLLTYWLGRRLTGDKFAALLAMFVMATSVYFIKYAARAMTDVPFTFLFLCSICAWVLSEDDPRWYLAVGLFIGLAQMTRAMMGVGLPILFAADCFVTGRRPPLRYVISMLALAFAPPIAWYGHWIYIYRDRFFSAHATFLSQEVFGALDPPWRRYTGAPEYVWMVAKSYWPWLPFMITGLVLIVRKRDRRWWLVVFWIAVVFALCAVTKSRVLRYMLPAYPAFAILAALGLLRFVQPRHLSMALRVLTPVLAVVVLWVAIVPPVTLHAAEILPLALATTAQTPAFSLVTFYDAGVPRYDESNQLLWYGNCYLNFVSEREKLEQALRQPPSHLFIVDRDTYQRYLKNERVVAESGHLVFVYVGMSADAAN